MHHRPHKIRALSKPKHIHKHERRHYWPYIPVLLLLIATFLVSTLQPIHDKNVLAYATNMSIDQLLVATNEQRKQNSASELLLNPSLSAAAQAKANDMVARNYWSHNTPDGEEPWVFVNKEGYKYLKAGENLAYGFKTSNDTVVGWMNSPSHRDNLLDTDFNEVGFGFANGVNYNNTGPETVVVAMYGKPQVLASANQAPVAPPTAAPTEPRTQQNAPIVTPPTAAPKPQPDKSQNLPVTTEQTTVNEPRTMAIVKGQTITGGKAPWVSFVGGLAVGIALVVLLIKHAAGLRHVLRDGERFVLHHPLLDTVLVSLVLLGTILSKTTGFIR
ncbi:MAG TPA: CAP domain-containing protein [Candidatus Limnocylindrales bacterium]|nr:CAP domain-containing protein [Candidatus Limnocylindrales bacterium]